MMDYFKHIWLVPAVIAWGFVVLACFIGHGSVLVRWLRLEPQPWPILSVFGAALLIPIGGVLNLLAISKPPAIFLLLALGLWVGRREAAKAYRETLASLRFTLVEGGPILKVFVAVALGFVLLRLFGEARPWAIFFNHDDDFQAYLTHPVRMLQTGTFGDDPYCYRRLSSLGGNSFLQCFFLAALPLNSVRYMDIGMGLLILLGLVSHYARQIKLPLPQKVALLFVIAVVPAPDVNTTSLLVAISFFFALYLILNQFDEIDSGEFQWRRALAIAFLGAGICAAKSTITLGFGVLATAYYLLVAFRKRRFAVLVESAASALVIAILLFPWMILMRHSSGTYFFPFLGRGFEAASYGIASTDPIQLSMFRDQLWVGLVSGWYWPFALLCWARKDWFAKPAFLSLALASVGGVLLLIGGAQCFPYDTFRYAFPYLGAFYLIALGLALRRSSAFPIAWLAAVFLFFGPAIQLPLDIARQYHMYVQTLTRRYKEGEISSPADLASLRAAQNSVPAGATILSRVAMPFLLDFARNPIYLQDIGAGPSPPPGLPAKVGPEALANYYRGQNLQYIMYQPSVSDVLDRIPKAAKTQYFPKFYILMPELGLVLHTNYTGIRATCRELYDDGTNWVVDLKAPAK